MWRIFRYGQRCPCDRQQSVAAPKIVFSLAEEALAAEAEEGCPMGAIGNDGDLGNEYWPEWKTWKKS
jgi:hypothetical protein